MSDDTSIIAATVDDQSAVVSLWGTCDLIVSHNPPEGDFRRAIESENATILVARAAEVIIGTVMVGDDGHRAWIYYLATDPVHQRTGLGRALVDAAETWAAQRGARKIQLMIRPSNHDVQNFYTATGYNETPRLVMAKWLDKEMAQKQMKDRN